MRAMLPGDRGLLLALAFGDPQSLFRKLNLRGFREPRRFLEGPKSLKRSLAPFDSVVHKIAEKSERTSFNRLLLVLPAGDCFPLDLEQIRQVLRRQSDSLPHESESLT